MKIEIAETVRILLITSCLVLVHSFAFAVPITWDGDAGSAKWSDPKNWSGDLLPTSVDDVIINSAVTVDLDISTQVQSLYMDLATLNIAFTGRLIVAVSSLNAIEMIDAEINNQGYLEVILSGSRGIYMTGTSVLENNDSVVVTDCISRGFEIGVGCKVNNHHAIVCRDVSLGIYNVGTFTNFGQCDISETNASSGHGIENRFGAVISNKAGGTIVCSNLSNSNSSGVTNSGIISNNGKIAISNTALRGISNSSSFVNNDSLLIDSTLADGIFNQGTFENNSAGVIEIKALYGSVSDGIQNQASFDNNGEISISDFSDNSGIINNLNAANFTNSGEIEIFDSYRGRGILHQDPATFTNTATGHIIIRDITGIISYGLYNLSTFTNDGKIDFIGLSDRAIVNFSSSALLINNDSICILNNGGRTIENNLNANINNTASGVLSISGSDFLLAAIIVNQEAMLTNAGQLIYENHVGIGAPLEVFLGSVLDCSGPLLIDTN